MGRPWPVLGGSWVRLGASGPGFGAPVGGSGPVLGASSWDFRIGRCTHPGKKPIMGWSWPVPGRSWVHLGAPGAGFGTPLGGSGRVEWETKTTARGNDRRAFSNAFFLVGAPRPHPAKFGFYYGKRTFFECNGYTASCASCRFFTLIKIRFLP